MKLLVALVSLALLGATPADTPAPATGAAAPAQLVEGESSGLVVDPDRRCATAPVIAQGREDEAELRREPAGPNPPPLMRAVDISVDGCDMMLTMSGELRELPAPPEDLRVLPAQ